MSPILEYKDSDQINHIYTQRRNQDKKTDKKKKKTESKLEYPDKNTNFEKQRRWYPYSEVEASNNLGLRQKQRNPIC